MKTGKKQHSHLKAVVIGLTIAISTLLSSSSFASTKDWVASQEYIVNNGKVYEYHILGDNKYICTIESDGSCNDDQGRVTSVLSYTHSKILTNITNASTTYQVTVYLFKKGNDVIWHSTDEKEISHTDPMSAK